MKAEITFQDAVHEACRQDPRFAPQAYGFLCLVLEHTQKMLGREEGDSRHVTGGEIMAGWRDLAVLEFGPMANLVMHEWGIQRSEDVGAMVYHFIGLRYFRKDGTDSIEDFSDGVNMVKALGGVSLGAK